MKKLTRHKFAFFITLISILGMGLASGYLIYTLSLLNNIENTLRLIGSVILVILFLVLTILAIRYLNKYKRAKLSVVIIFMILLGLIQGFAGYNIQKVYGALAQVSDTEGYTTYSSSLVTLSSNKATSIDDIKDSTLGILSDQSSVEGYVIPNEVMKKKNISNKTQEFESYINMIDALVAGDIDYIFVPTNYTVMFGSMDGYSDIADKTKIIFTEKKKIKDKKNNSKNSSKPITEPFTVLLMGVDSEEENIQNGSFNGDSLMVITFNPKTLSATILSIPRDSYVPIACFPGQRKNKITHAAWKGENCMIDTIQNFLDVDIDYFVKINFKGVVKLVDTLGGVNIDVPYNLCEQDSSRRWGANTVYIEKGMQSLNGEQALAYSRNRHPNPSMCSAKWTNYNSNDFIRGQHQQEVVMALLDKFKSVNSLDTVYKLLDTISSSMSTNMSTDQILSLYNVMKDIATKSEGMENISSALGLQRLYLNGHDARIVDYGGTNLSLYNYVLYDNSVKEVSNAMKENLGLKKVKVIKSFSFDINNPYEETIIGKNTRGSSSLVQLPSFVGKTLSYANSFCSSHGIKVNAKGGNGYVISQSVAAGANVEDVKSITLTVGGETNNTNKKTTTQTKEPDEKEKDTLDKTGVLPSDKDKDDENSDPDNTDNTTPTE